MNIAAPLYRVNRSGLILGALVVVAAACKLWLTLGVELGKDEAAYWYWSLNWDLTYAPLPFALIRLAHTLAPGVEWVLRAGPVVTGMLATMLMFQWCRSNGLSETRSLWAAAAFTTSHWIWHSSSFLHPDGFLVPAWLLVLVLAHRAANAAWTPVSCFGMGLVTAIPPYCKYSGALLAASVFIWLYFAGTPLELRRRVLASSLLAFGVCMAPLVVTHWSDGFHLPRALSTLSRIAGETSIFARGGLFLVAPLLFVSPLLLWLLYGTLCSIALAAGRALHSASIASRPTCMRAHGRLLLALIPASMVLLCFGFFALYRGQVKGNWILPAFLTLWPYVFGARTSVGSDDRQPGTGLLLAVIIVGLMQTAAVGLALKSPGTADSIMRTLGIQQILDQSYPRLVSPVDQTREPTRSWNERLCEYAGWRTFTGKLEHSISEAGLPLSVALVSTQYNVPFTTAYYARPETGRSIYTVADPRFVRLAGLETAAAPETLLFVARSHSPLPTELAGFVTSPLPGIQRTATGCSPVAYELTLVVRDGTADR